MKTRVLIYSGHCEIVGGDGKFLVDLIESIDLTRFDVEVVTDVNPAFETRAAGRVTARVPLAYLDTLPRLFPASRVERFYRSLERSPSRSAVGERLWRMLSASWRGRERYRYLRRLEWTLLDALRVAPLTDRIRNAGIFQRVFSDAGQVDVFHFNNGGYPAKRSGLVAMLLARWRGVPTVLMTCHSMAEPRRWYQVLDLLFDRLIAGACTAVFTASEAGRQSMLRHRGFPPDKVKTVYCGLPDVSDDAPQNRASVRRALGLDDDTLMLLMVGNLDWEGKGFDPMFRALARIRQQRANVRLVIAGGGEPERLADLRRLSASTGVADVVDFLGFRSDIAELNAAADIAVAPYTGFEATPYTIKEAARAGRPIVTTTSGGCAEAVDAGVSGLIVPPGDVDALAAAVLELAGDPGTRARMGQCARAIYEARFRLADKVREHERWYARAVDIAPEAGPASDRLVHR